MATNFDITYTLKNIKPPFIGGNVDLNPTMITNFYFIENIENMFMTGAMNIEDTGGFFEKLPLTGEETLLINIQQNIEDKTNASNNTNITKIIEFEIFKTPIKDTQAIRIANYEFILVEKGFYNFFKKQFSKSYSQKRIDEIIIDICRNQLKLNSNEYDIEQTSDKIDYVIPYWKPSVTIRDLVKKSRRYKTPNEGGFLFYSTIGDDDEDKPIKKFTSFGALLEQKISKDKNQAFYFKVQDINPQFINNFKEVRNPNFNNRSILTNGISGKKYYNVDFITNKKITETEKTFSQFVDNATLLGTKAYLSENLDDTDSDVKFVGYESENLVKALQDYNFRMALENFNKREVVLDGLLDRYAGRKIYLEENSDNVSDLFNERETGEWLIKSVTHYFTIDSFEQRMTIIKDAFSKSDVVGHKSL